MKPVSFAQAIGVALLGAILAAAGFHLARFGFTAYESSRAVIVLVGLGYAGFLLLQSPRRDGRVLGLGLWLAGTGMTVLLDPPVFFYLLGQVVTFWLIRALCHHRRIVHGVLDAGSSVLSVAACVWAFAGTGSVFLACWSLLLCQALFAVLGKPKGVHEPPCSELCAQFDRARRGAELALRRVAT